MKSPTRRTASHTGPNRLEEIGRNCRMSTRDSTDKLSSIREKEVRNYPGSLRTDFQVRDKQRAGSVEHIKWGCTVTIPGQK